LQKGDVQNVFELKIMLKLPEYDVRVSVLGHTQPWWSPLFDRVLASRLGVKAVSHCWKENQVIYWFAK
jgi:6-phosphofructokinase